MEPVMLQVLLQKLYGLGSSSTISLTTWPGRWTVREGAESGSAELVRLNDSDPHEGLLVVAFDVCNVPSQRLDVVFGRLLISNYFAHGVVSLGLDPQRKKVVCVGSRMTREITDPNLVLDLVRQTAALSAHHRSTLVAESLL